MNRLTARDEFGNADIIGVDSVDLQLKLPFHAMNRVTEALNRLAAYEDTGLEPDQVERYAKADREGRYIVLKDRERKGVERLREISKADAEGRLVVLPCKVGDTVYLVERSAILEEKVLAFAVTGHGLNMTITYRDYVTRPLCENIGKLFGDKYLSVFLTREEAEAAMGGDTSCTQSTT